MNRIKTLLLNEPIKNFLKVFSSGVFAQGLSFVLAPVFSRLFTPDDFGLLALYLSIFSILSVFSTGKYEQAIMLPKENKDAINIFALVIIITAAVSLFLTAITPFFIYYTKEIFANNKIAPWLWFIPLSVLMHGIVQGLTFWYNRNKKFGTIAQSTLFNYIPLNSAKLVTGFAKTPFNGLILSNIIGMFSITVFLTVRFFKSIPYLFANTTLKDIRKNAKIYSVYPKYNMIHTFTNNFSGTLPVFLFTWGFSSEAAGLYSFGHVFVFKPLNIISNSILQVLSQKTIEDFNKGINILPNIKKMIKVLFNVGILPFIVLFFFAPEIFDFLFSSNYREAGVYLQILTPWLFMVFLTSSLSFIPEMYFRQKTAMFIDIIYFILRFLALAIGVYYSNIKLSLILFSAVNFVIISIKLIWYIKLSKTSLNLKSHTETDNISES
ncbi:MAG: oligosaccharide flippase family protein [Bacteroidales bacterium]